MDLKCLLSTLLYLPAWSFSLEDADLITVAVSLTRRGCETLCVSVSDSSQRRSGLPGLSSSQQAPHSAEASGFPHGGQRKEGVPLKLSAELNQQELQPATLWLLFIFLWGGKDANRGAEKKNEWRGLGWSCMQGGNVVNKNTVCGWQRNRFSDQNGTFPPVLHHDLPKWLFLESKLSYKPL